jgi:hypothetical protein
VFSSSSFVLSVPTPPAPPGGYQSAHDVARALILATLRGSSVASVAGVQADLWASTASPRVLAGTRDGYIAGLHRGRLPAIEVWPDAESWEHAAAEGGGQTSVWALRVHTRGPSLEAADSTARRIIAACFSVLRAQDQLDVGGGEAVDTLTATPYGFALGARFSVTTSYGREAYEITGA